MSVKKHLEGGSLRTAMANEVKRVMQRHSGDKQFFIERVAIELGITPKTLRQWLGPVEKGGWPEFQVTDAMEKVLSVKPKRMKRQPLKKLKRKSVEKTA